ncbi:uncharacterized protein LAESUDRAFT_812950 [Laetiporus sulphureus 93-53]|uniref:Sorting nexin C-terminal domain-containing protein n=1 Tax=Laetiporus sulphureus 93-53 TaxID=1314785 RepID=A0A165E780_9APHY|nr:uncharacterized protein LAESUDRAFT_812950 [Laetiporus sulphureus 93-53]KZT06373.1 hypothetical protein LAESUDRAFT_812950 [Laetiporus sulphureus 93-53]
MRRSNSSSTVRKSSTSSTPPIPSHAAASIPAPTDYAHPPLTMLLTLLSPPPLSASTAMAQSTPATSTWTSLALTYTLSLPLTFFEPFVSRLLPYLLYTHVLSALRLTEIVRAARRALFPEGWPGPTPPEPTPEEQVAIRTELRRRLLAAVPVPLAVFLGPTPEARAYTIDAMLDPLSSQACNAHLTLFILDLVLLTVFPELGASETAAAAVTEGSVDRTGAT